MGGFELGQLGLGLVIELVGGGWLVEVGLLCVWGLLLLGGW